MLQNVMFAGRAESEARAGWPDWAVISITGLDPARIKSGWYSVLRLEFDDIDVADPDFQAAEPYVLFNHTHALSIIDFAEQCHDGKVQGILVHCQAGISRSAAVAKWIAERYELPFNHGYSLYNRHVYSTLRETRNRKMLGDSV